MQGVELAVLSACESGLGAVSFGEGLLGLKRALLAAGARNVVSTAWRIDDEATSRLMTTFYSHLWEKNLPCADALTTAQRALIASDRSRKTRVGIQGWGAFTVTAGP